mmetsp:Transcript_12860/g.14126  ORF Transcript_12860/g.14126 Transcript_12860/m.14126 type:complete len:551 (+) Transcript_12860:35-1687(+)
MEDSHRKFRDEMASIRPGNDENGHTSPNSHEDISFEPPEKITLEEAIEHVGGWNKFQVLPITMIATMWIGGSIFFYGYAFSSKKSDYECHNPLAHEWYSCEREEACSDHMEYRINHHHDEWTLTDEYDMYCDDRTYFGILGAASLAGSMLIGYPLTHVADRMGRRWVMVRGMMVFFLLAAAVLAFAAYSRVLLVMLSFMIVGFFAGSNLSGCSLLVEFISPQYRQTAIALLSCLDGLALILLLGLVLVKNHWQYIFGLSYIVILCGGLMLYYTPESPRFLLTVLKDQRGARAIFERIAITNGRPMFTAELYVPELEDQQTGSNRQGLTDLWMSSKYRTRLLICAGCWFVCGFSYYIIQFDIPNISDEAESVYRDAALIGGAEMLGNGLPLILTPWVSRPRQMFLYYGTTALGAVLYAMVAEEDDETGIAYICVSRIGISGAYTIVYTMATELFPTTVRVVGLGICFIAARIGATAAPLVVELYRDEHNPYPPVIALCLVQAILVLWLPDTSKEPLEDAIVKEGHFFGPLKNDSLLGPDEDENECNPLLGC